MEETYTLFSCRLKLHPPSLISIMDASIVTTAGLGYLKVSRVVHAILPCGQSAAPIYKIIVIPVPSRDVTNQTLPGREFFNYSRPG